MAVFDHQDYRGYLLERLATNGPTRGLRSKLAKELNCQSAFISQSLDGKSHFSLEHAFKINQFLNHSPDEAHYFMLLVQRDRAGSKGLEGYYTKQIDSIQKRREQVKERVGNQVQLSQESQMRYYSHWYFVAVHIAIAIPKYRTPESISVYLGISLSIVKESLEFLQSVGLVVADGSKYTIGKTRLHLGSDSPMIHQHHANWRLQALQAVGKNNNQSVYFSTLWAISKEDSVKIKKKLLNAIEELEPICMASKEEALFCMNLDFFQLGTEII
ncbi:MAG: TIGR02147 family protein [Proteobacteria bacterium]|nr:TIGR02147 family protein [Pseudomonadota bacterium]